MPSIDYRSVALFGPGQLQTHRPPERLRDRLHAMVYAYECGLVLAGRE
jgi:hypothetical protein